MKVDVDKGDRCEVFLNGVDVSMLTFYADDKKGIVKGHMRGTEGQHLIDRENDKLLEWVSCGHVEIIPKKLRENKMNKILWYLKQLLPLNYKTTYGMDGKTHYCEWKMFLGRCYNIKDRVCK